MQKKWIKLLRQAAPYTKKNHRRRIWQKIVQFMACIVVFCTTYALILPAITMEKTFCGMEEHTHSDACYTQSEENPDTLTCGLAEAPGHVHTENCFDENGELVCTEQLEAHTHTERCYGTWTLTCTLPEHTHNTDCTTLLALSEEDRAEVEAVIALIDQLPSYEEMEATLLAYEEAEDLEGYEAYYTEIETQSRTAYDAYQALTAEQQACVTNIDKLMELEPVWNNQASTPEETILCTLEEHTHNETCLDETGNLICGMEEHSHFELCTDPSAQIYCWLTEHRHSESCMDENGSILCGLDEHVHESRCCDHIGSLVVMIDTLPTTEEAEETLLAYEEAEDWEGREEYQQEVSDLAWRLYYACEELEEDELALVTNYDRLMDLSWLWSAMPYALPAKSPYYPMDNGEWITNISEENPFYEYVHINEVVPDEYTVDGLVLGAKLTDACEPSFTPVFTSSLKDLTDEECIALTGYSWEAMDAAGLDNTYGANLILPANDVDHDALVEDKKTFVVYRNVGTYGEDTIHLLVQIVNYKPFKDDNGVDHDGILGFYSNGYIGVAVCGVEWVKLQYNFIEDKDITEAVEKAKNGESLTGLRRTVKGSTSFYDIDYSQAVHLHGSEGTPWTEMLTGIYVTDVTSDVPDLSEVDALTNNTAKRNYFRNWPQNDCVLKIGTVDDAYSSWTGPAIFSSHPYDDANEDWRTDSKHGATVTFDHTWFYMNYSFNKGRNADGGIRHFGEPVSRGSLTIEKAVANTSVTTDQEFEFQITFHKQKSDGTYVADTALDGTYGGVTLTNGVGTFKLKDGQSITINNIPIRQHGTHYRVTELSHDGYIVETSMSSQIKGEELTENGPYTTDYYENSLQADALMAQHQVVTFRNIHNSISVVKELTSTTGVEMVGDPEFSFQIMKADANGNKTTNPFFGEGVTYNIYDTATNTQIGTGTTETYGVFKIKAGQRAEFTGISENSGKYYVREILDKTFIGQYNQISVDGSVITARPDVYNPIDEVTYTGVESPVKDFSDGTTIFTYNNQVDTEKLSYLTITKMVEGVSSDVEKTLEFDMMVELNGTLKGTEGWTPIPVGTPYTLYRTDEFINNGQKVKIEKNPDRVVTKEGIVTVPGGATAEIDYMIPGTTWRVYETSGSAEGYTVGYGEFWGGDWITAYDDRVEGTIPVYNESNLKTAHVCMTVTNTVPSGAVTIPATKTLFNGSADPSTPHTYSFTIKLESASDYSSGTQYVEGTHYAPYSVTKEIQVTGSNPTNFNFIITYSAADFAKGKTTILTYSIKENKPDELESTHDTAEYTAIVVVTKAANGSLYPAPYLHSLTKNGQTVTSAAFTNTLLGDLTLEKQVIGGSLSQANSSFDFSVQIGTDATTALQNWTVQVIKNGESAGTATTNSSGIINLTGIKHGDRVQLKGIPLGCVWKITEADTDGYLVTWTANGVSGSSNEATGNIPAGGMEVVYTNTSTYALPETGGVGTSAFYILGVLVMLAAAVLAARKRRPIG